MTFGLLKALEPLIHAKDFSGVFNLTPLAQVKQFAAPVRAFKIASIRAALIVLPCALAQAAILFQSIGIEVLLL